MDSARHVIGCHSSRETRVQNALDDVASTIRQSWVSRGFETRSMTWRALSMSPYAWAYREELEGVTERYLAVFEAGAYTRPLFSST
jgi:hypothetical protein